LAVIGWQKEKSEEVFLIAFSANCKLMTANSATYRSNA